MLNKAEVPPMLQVTWPVNVLDFNYYMLTV